MIFRSFSSSTVGRKLNYTQTSNQHFTAIFNVSERSTNLRRLPERQFTDWITDQHQKTGNIWDVDLAEDRKDQLDGTFNWWPSTDDVVEQRSLMNTIRERQRNWIGRILRGKSLLRTVLEGKSSAQDRVRRRQYHQNLPTAENLEEEEPINSIKAVKADKAVVCSI